MPRKPYVDPDPYNHSNTGPDAGNVMFAMAISLTLVFWIGSILLRYWVGFVQGREILLLETISFAVYWVIGKLSTTS